MAEIRINNYEAMFLLNQAVAADLGGAVTHIREILDKADAQIIAMKKWDERRLAYEIDKQKRGVYILVYFSCNARNVTQIERSCNLSERIMRHLIIRAEHMTTEEMQAADAQKELETEARLRSERAANPATPPKPGEEQPAAAGAGDESSED
jgi:small subunit ribosomal protein S6